MYLYILQRDYVLSVSVNLHEIRFILSLKFSSLELVQKYLLVSPSMMDLPVLVGGMMCCVHIHIAVALLV